VLGIDQQGSSGLARKQQQQAVDPRLQELILHVQAGLGKALRGADAAQVGCSSDILCKGLQEQRFELFLRGLTISFCSSQWITINIKMQHKQ
jgi:hypothetical protein